MPKNLLEHACYLLQQYSSLLNMPLGMNWIFFSTMSFWIFYDSMNDKFWLAFLERPWSEQTCWFILEKIDFRCWLMSTGAEETECCLRLLISRGISRLPINSTFWILRPWIISWAASFAQEFFSFECLQRCLLPLKNEMNNWTFSRQQTEIVWWKRWCGNKTWRSSAPRLNYEQIK